MTTKPNDYLNDDAQAALAEAARRAGRGPVRRLIRSALPPTSVRHEGLVFNIDPARNYTDFFMWMHGHPKERKSLDSIIAAVTGQKVCFIDIGANMGLYTLCVAQHAGAGSRILAFEPNPDMAARLRSNIEANVLPKSDIHVIERAVGAKEGQSKLYVPINAGQASVRRIEGDETHAVNVDIAPLSAYLPKSGTVWDRVVLKVDIEGYEDAALGNLLDCDDNDLPDVILLEVTHRTRWNIDIVAALLTRGYVVADEMEGNAFLKHS